MYHFHGYIAACWRVVVEGYAYSYWLQPGMWVERGRGLGKVESDGTGEGPWIGDYNNKVTRNRTGGNSSIV